MDFHDVKCFFSEAAPMAHSWAPTFHVFRIWDPRCFTSIYKNSGKSDPARVCDMFSGQPNFFSLPTWIFSKVGPGSPAFLMDSRSMFLSLRRNPW